MKHILPGLLLPLMLVLQPTAALALAGGPALSLQLSPSTVGVNGQFTATVQLNTNSYQVSAVELHLTFPAAQLQALSVTKGSFLSSVLTAGTVGSGTASITLGSGTTPVSGSGPIAIITFKALAGGSPSIGFAGTTAIAATGNTANVVGTMTPVTVTISGTQSPTSSPVGSVGQASRVSTGPMESTLVALLVGTIITLLYVGYAGSDSFRRREVEDIAKQERDRPTDLNR